MSWSVSAIGKPAAVAEKLAGNFAVMLPMHEPEETGKNAAARKEGQSVNDQD
jgi:hypothetical protein